MKNNRIDASSITANHNDGKYVIYFSDEDEYSQNENHDNFSEKEQIVSDNRSLKFVKQRIATGECNGMENNKYDEMTCSNFEEILRNQLTEQAWSLYKDHRLEFALQNVKIDHSNETGEFKITIQYDPDAEFEYFTMKRGTCDGTLMFFNDLCYEVINKLMHMGTYNGNTLPSDFNDNPFKYDVKYTVGDFVLGSEHGKEFATSEKPWMQSRFTVMLPIKYEWIEESVNNNE